MSSSAIHGDAQRRAWDKRGRSSDFGSPTFDINGTKDTRDTFQRPDGSWTPERAALHEQIIEGILAGKQPSADPTVFVLGGGPASGKTGALKSGAMDYVPSADAPTNALVNPDAIRRQLPEWNAYKDAHTHTTSMLHEEASYVAHEAMVRGVSRGYDMTLDGTGDSPPDRLAAKLADYRQHGHKVVGAYVSLDTDEAWSRAHGRALNPKSQDFGRLPPPDYFYNNHAAISRNFTTNARLFDRVDVFDTSGPRGSKPILMASGGKGRPVKVHNEALYSKFLAKSGKAVAPPSAHKDWSNLMAELAKVRK